MLQCIYAYVYIYILYIYIYIYIRNASFKCLRSNIHE